MLSCTLAVFASQLLRPNASAACTLTCCAYMRQMLSGMGVGMCVDMHDVRQNELCPLDFWSRRRAMPARAWSVQSCQAGHAFCSLCIKVMAWKT